MKLPASLVFPVLGLLSLISTSCAQQPAPPPLPAPSPGPDGWITLFDGKDLSAFMDSSGNPPRWTVENGTLHGDDKRGDIWTKAAFGDFVLEVEFKTAGNSGVFFRTDNPQDPVQTGIEVQVHKGGGADKHSVGAIYDLVPPVKNAARADDWNQYRITARGAEITVELNGEKVSAMNLDLWTKAGKNPDGSGNKFNKALRDFARTGRIGFQDHGDKVWYRNVRVKPLPAAE